MPLTNSTSIREPAAVETLYLFADMTDDDDLAVAILQRLDTIADEYGQLRGLMKE